MAIPTTLPGKQIGCRREIIYRTEISESMSGIEYRSSWQTSPRYRYEVTVIGRKQASGELSSMAAAVTDVRGEFSTFSFVDPYDGVTRTCRLDGMPTFTEWRIPGWWQATYTLISVL